MAKATEAKYARDGSERNKRLRGGIRSMTSANAAYSVSRMNSMAGESGVRMVGVGECRAGGMGLKEAVDGDGDGDGLVAGGES